MSHFVKAKLDKIKNEMEEQKFLRSESYRAYLERVVRGTSGNHKHKVVFASTVATDGETVFVNPLHPYLEKESLAEKTLIIFGQLMHEMFHLIYTDFQTLLTIRELKENDFRKKTIKKIFNIVEDSAIEFLGTNYYTGTRTSIAALNRNAIKNIPKIKEMAKTAPPLSLFLSACAAYCILEINEKTALKGKVKTLFLKAIPIMDKAKHAKHSRERYSATLEIFKLALPLIADAEKNQEEEKVEQIFVYPKNREMNAREDSEDEAPFYNMQNGTGESDSPQNNEVKAEGKTKAKEKKAAEEKKEEEEAEEALKEIEKQLEKVKDDAAKEVACEENEKEKTAEIVKFAKNVKYSDLHRGILVRVIRKFNLGANSETRYDTIFSPIKSLARNFAKSLEEIIKYNEDSKLAGLYNGKVNKGHLYRRDKKHFCQRKEKSNEANLAILILIDESGSMNGVRINYARLACMLMYDVCKSLQIPLAVIGHRAINRKNEVHHAHYVDFESFNNKEKYNLLAMHAVNNTREGVSLKYAGDYLLNRPEEDKILLVISDGEPYHAGPHFTYHGDIAKKDTKEVTKKLNHLGIKVFGIAIGDGKNSIKDIYTSNYIDVPNIKMLPTKLLSIIKNNMFK